MQLTGFSQGGGTVAQVAASGQFSVTGVATFGGPTGQVHLPTGIPVVIVEHLDDPVPALGGSQANDAAVVVRRDVFGGTGLPDDLAVPSHHAEYYAETATLMDRSHDAALAAAVARLDAFGAGATTVTSVAYEFDRPAPSGTWACR